ncbi:hypothetical protein ACFXPA_31305 [Amycolatopsis sp. NPDC059090]|uniref:hypothetical protein n=1 Tax=Amycolatopsis sp. NPDC059090 TaxID=3346723 RepID=UPI00366C1327
MRSFLLVRIGIAMSCLKSRTAPAPRGAAEARAGQRRAVAARAVSSAIAIMLIGMAFVPDTQLELIMTATLVLVAFSIVLWRETGESADPDR